MHLRFAGDDRIHAVPRSKVVKIPTHGNNRILAVGKDKAKSLLLATRSKPADDYGIYYYLLGFS